MTSHLVSLLLLATVTLCAAQKLLTHQENADLQQSCGLDARYRTKVLNGEGHLDYPFAAVVNVKGVLTATVISPRHVLLFNVFEMDNRSGRVTLFNDTEIALNPTGLTGVGECDKKDWVFPEHANSLFHIKFAIEQFGGQATSKVSRIVVIGGCHSGLDTYKPMVLELEQDLTFDKTHGAICLPNADDDVDAYSRESQEFTVFGMGPKGQALTSAQYIKKETCGKDFKDGIHVFCGAPVNESRGLCQGDFGGGAITTIDGRQTLLGVFAEGNIDCKLAPEDHQDPEFIDIAKYTKAICRQTGVCPDAGEYETTVGVPYVPFFYTEEPTTEEPPTETPESIYTVETMVAETYEKMALNCSDNEHREEKPKEIHIHIHLDKDAKVHFD